MQNLFISYRREDSADVAGRIYDRLCEHFGTDGIFMDVDKIPIGVDFRQHLDDEVSRCAVLLVIIGRHWLDTSTEAGTRRLDDPSDFVRIEIESALKRGVPVVPLLVHGTQMPGAHELPDLIRDLAFRNGIPVRADPDFHNDMDRLKLGLAHHLDGPPSLNATEAAKSIAAEATADAAAPPVHADTRQPGKGSTSASARWRLPAALAGVLLLLAGGGWLAADRLGVADFGSTAGNQGDDVSSGLTAIRKRDAQAEAETRARREAEQQARAEAARLRRERDRVAMATEARRLEEEQARRAEDARRLETERARAEEARREAERRSAVRLAVFPDESNQACYHSVRGRVEDAAAVLDQEFENVSLVYSYYAPGPPPAGIRDSSDVWTGESVRKHPALERVRAVARRLGADTVLMGWFNCSARSNVSDYSYEVDLYLVDVASGQVVRTRAGAYDTNEAARRLLPQLLARRAEASG